MQDPFFGVISIPIRIFFTESKSLLSFATYLYNLSWLPDN